MSGLQILFFGGVVSAYFHQGRIEEASKVLKRNLSLSEQPWGPGQVGTLVQVAWQYVNILRDYKTAGSLGDQAAKTVIAAGGERSDQMRGVEELKLRLAQVEDDPIAISEHTAKLRQLFIAVHGPKTKPLMIH